MPEAGDGVLTFLPDVLADRVRYAGGPPGGARHEREAAAWRRRDLAIEGFLGLQEQVERDGPAALEAF